MRKSDCTVLWPVYFDSTKTRSEGRRISKKLGIVAPTLNMIEKALTSLNLNYDSITDASHPHYPWKKTGMIIVKKRRDRNRLMKDIAKELTAL